MIAPQQKTLIGTKNVYTGNFTNNNNLSDFLVDAKERFKKHHGEEYILYLEKIKELVKTCESYRELGVMQGVSMASAICGNPGLSFCHGVDLDFSRLEDHKQLFKEFSGVLKWTETNSVNKKIEWNPVDLLFIDSSHSAIHLRRELLLHEKFVNKYILVHDTHHIKKLKKTIDDFIRKNKRKWKLIKHYKSSVGFSVLERITV